MPKELAPKIIRKVVPNSQCVCLDVNIRISTDYIESFHLPLADYAEESLKKVGPIGSELVRKLGGILGVKEVSLSQYGIQLTVGGAFNPDEDGITEDAIEALKGCFGDKRDEVQVINKNDRHLYGRSMMDDDDFGFGGSIFTRGFGRGGPTDEDIDTLVEEVDDLDREINGFSKETEEVALMDEEHGAPGEDIDGPLKQGPDEVENALGDNVDETPQEEPVKPQDTTEEAKTVD